MSSRVIFGFLAAVAVLCSVSLLVLALIPDPAAPKRPERLHGQQGGRMGDFLRSQEGGHG